MGQARRGFTFVLVCVATFLAFGGAVRSDAAAEPPLTAAFTPATITLGPGQTRAVALAISNPSAAPLSDLHVSFVADAGLEVLPTGAIPATIEANQTIVVPATVERAFGAAGDLSVLAIVTWRVSTGGAETSVVASLTASDEAGEAASLTAVFTPSSVTVPPGETRSSVLVVTNAGDLPMEGVDVSLSAGEGISVPSSIPAFDLEPSESTAIAIDVQRAPTALGASSVIASVGFSRAGTPGSVAVELMLPVPTAATAKAAAISINGELGASELVQYSTTDAFFTISNVSSHSQRLEQISIAYPTYLGVHLAGEAPPEKRDGLLTLKEPVELVAGDSYVVHLVIDASKPVQPGKTLLVVTAKAVDQVDRTTTTVVASKPLTLTVFGESAVLETLAVPALLFVPGLVFAIVLALLVKVVFPRPATLNMPSLGVDGKVVFWVLALLPALVFPFVYPPLTDLILGERRDYRRVYGLDDILYAWIMAAATAAALWLVFVAWTVVARRFFVPREDDDALTVVRKLAAQVWRRKLVRTMATTAAQNVAVIGGRRRAEPLVAPPIVLSTIGLTPAEQAELATLNPDRPIRLCRFIKRHSNVVAAGYTPGGPITHPNHVDKTALAFGVEAPVVQ